MWYWLSGQAAGSEEMSVLLELQPYVLSINLYYAYKSVTCRNLKIIYLAHL